MPSSFMVKRNYAHCPLKKRPLALYNESAVVPVQDEPEDLSIKRPRAKSPAAVAASSEIEAIPPAPYQPVYTQVQNVLPRSIPRYVPSPPTSQQENLPNLAEYYLQLFKVTSETDSCKSESVNPKCWSPSYLPPSPQTSPVSPDQIVPSVNPSVPVAASWTYPEPSALISPVSVCSTESEDEYQQASRSSAKREARYSCEDCGKSYSTYSGLSKHKQFHCLALGAKSFGCKHCDKVYTTLGALKMHIRTHTLPCKCHLCGKAFSRPWLLQGHIRTHTGEKPFQCQQCDRSFADRSNLRAHLQTHAEVKKYSCSHCHKTFSRISLLKKHVDGSCPTMRAQSSLRQQEVPCKEEILH